MKQVRGSTIRKKQKAPVRTFKDSLTSYRDVLDVVLKTVVVLLPVSAIQTYAYLRLIGQQDIFISAMSSAAGIYTMLQVSSIFAIALSICVAGPSVVMWGFDSFLKNKPSKEMVIFALKGALISAVVYGVVLGIWGNEPSVARIMAAGLLAAFFSMFAIALWSPPLLTVIPRDDTVDSARNKPGQTIQPTLPKWLDKIWHRNPRLWRGAFCAFCMVAAGSLSLLAILTVYGFGDAFALPSIGWVAASIMGCVVFASFVPGLIFLVLRASGLSRMGAFKRTAIFAGMILLASPISIRFIAPPMTIATMKAIGIVDAIPRTYEVLKKDEREVYRALGFTAGSLPSPDYRFVRAVVGFQMGDIRLICPRPFEFPRGWALQEKLHVDSTGCLIAGKDEIRLVDAPGSVGTDKVAPAGQRADSPSNPVGGATQSEEHPSETPLTDLARSSERFAVGLALILGGIVLALVGRRSRVAIATGVGVSVVGLALSLTARGQLEFTALRLDKLIGSLQGSLQITYAPKQDVTGQPLFAHIVSIGPFPTAENELDADAVTACVANAIQSFGAPAPTGWHIVGGVDKRVLRAHKAAVYGTNQALAMARAVWVRDNVLVKVEGPQVASDAMVTIAGASNVGTIVDDTRLAADRSVQLYAFVSSEQGARLASAVHCH